MTPTTPKTKISIANLVSGDRFDTRSIRNTLSLSNICIVVLALSRKNNSAPIHTVSKSNLPLFGKTFIKGLWKKQNPAFPIPGSSPSQYNTFDNQLIQGVGADEQADYHMEDGKEIVELL